MIHLKWQEASVKKRIRCVHTNAKKYKVNNMLTEGKEYDVINETEEFYFIIDNSKRVAGFYKEYFEEI